MEIYNETITDLLCGTEKMKPLIIREDFNVSNRVNRVAQKIELLIEIIFLEHLPLISIYFKVSPVTMVCFLFSFLNIYRDYLLSNMYSF